MLEDRRQSITFFIVGRDAAMPRNRALMRALADAGHEIASHSQPRPVAAEAQLKEGLSNAEQAIADATGVRPAGFRGPGFSLSDATLRVLARRGYLYDGTVSESVESARARLFPCSQQAQCGGAQASRRPVRHLAGRVQTVTAVRLDRRRSPLEIPVTTMPLLKVPIHMSYVLHLGRISRSLSRTYFREALGLCAQTVLRASMLLHPLDFLGREDGIEPLAFFPGMDLPLADKLAIVTESLDAMARHWQLVTMREHAVELLGVGDLVRHNVSRAGAKQISVGGRPAPCRRGHAWRLAAAPARRRLPFTPSVTSAGT